MDRATAPHLFAGLALLGALLIGGLLLGAGRDGARFVAAISMIIVIGLAFKAPPARPTTERRLPSRAHDADG